MPVEQNLYQIFKLPASMLVENECVIPKYSRDEGEAQGNIVSIGDNIVFQQIRHLKGDYRGHKEIYEEIQGLRSHAHRYKKQGDYHRVHILNQIISDKLFVKEIVNVYVDKKKSDFNKFRTKGFSFNGTHYTYLCSGAGQIRRNTATFVDTNIYKKLYKHLSCGLDEKTSEMCLGKYSAYFALAFSSILWVTTPRVVVVKDFFHELKDQKVDYIVKDANGKASIEERTMNIELNCADGQGLIDPSFAENVWAKDMNLGFTPCSFVVRSCFVKGNLVPFDFKEYAKLHNITEIRDKWGFSHSLEDIDVILSESQFKTSKYYHSWEDYQKYATKYEISWGVARYNKKFDDENILANYQYIQALDLTKDEIKELITPTVDWIKKICSGDPLYAEMFWFGVKNYDANFNALYSSAQTTASKAVVKDIDFLKDSYVQQRIYKNIVDTINRSKIGKIWLKGNYQFCIADPLAQCQAILGLPHDGVVKADEVYSNWWLNHGKQGGDMIDIARSPMIDQHEHNPSKLHDSEDARYWFKYIYSGVIFSTWDTATARMEDSDFDKVIKNCQNKRR